MKETTFLFLLVFFSCVNALAQTRLDDVQVAKINFPKVVEYLHHQMDNGNQYFDGIKPSLKPGSKNDDYHVIAREFLIKDNLDAVWNTYLKAGLQKAWNTKKINYGFSYSRHLDSLFYTGDEACKLESGLIVFLNLKMLFGFKNLAMAFEVTQIDVEDKVLEFSYLKGNETEGKQQLIFDRTSKGYTLITHLSYYKSRVKPRDKLYPLVHTQIINRFHRNMKEIYKQQSVMH